MYLNRFSRPESETEKYIEKITDNEERYDLFRTVKQWKRATEVATKLKDPYKLQDVNHYYYYDYYYDDYYYYCYYYFIFNLPNNQIARNCQDPSLERQIQDILTKI